MADPKTPPAEIQEYLAAKIRVDAVKEYAALFTTPGTDGKVAEISEVTAIVKALYNNGTSQRIHSAEAFNTAAAAYIIAQGATFVAAVVAHAETTVEKEKLEAAQEAAGLGINKAAPVITSAATATGTVGAAFTYQIRAAHLYPGEFTPTYTAVGLPASLTCNSATGAITGTPVAGDAAVHTVNIRCTTPMGNGDKVLTLTIS